MKLTLDQIRIVGKKRIEYDYSYTKELSKYFSKEKFFVEYDVDISNVPLSIAAIPFLANIMPIAWFAGFEVIIDEVDDTFYKSLINLRMEFTVHFPEIKDESTLTTNNLVDNIFKDNNSALLFSGGLDSFESLTRNLKLEPYLVSILGADIEISDDKRWTEFQKFNKEEKIISEEKLLYVTSNLQTFYTYNVDLLVDTGWWGKIQHGMALISLIAPLSAVYGIRTVLIASSNTGEVSFGWGSTAETDEKMKWANQKTIHDGFHLRRTEKIQNIVNFAKSTGNYIKLRVCYSEWRTGYNCSRCPKCQRTMLGLILAGEDPHKYGFEVPDDFYTLLLSNFKQNASFTTGVKYEWTCLQEKALESENYFISKDAEVESKMIKEFASLPIKLIGGENNERKKEFNKTKYILRKRFSKIYNYYLQMRRSINLRK